MTRITYLVVILIALFVILVWRMWFVYCVIKCS